MDLVRSRVLKRGGTFRYYDVSEQIAALEKQGASLYVSYAIYCRLFIPDALQGEQGRVVYLDCDTLVVASLAELFELDMGGKPLAMVPDAVHPAYKRVINLPKNRSYYNTGVMLMELEAWRQARVTERLLEELKNPHGANPLPDQDIIARVLGEEIATLAKRWNFLSQFLLFRCRVQPAIYHFSGHTLGRPWYTSSKHPLRRKYCEAALEAELPQIAEQVKPMIFEYRGQYYLWRGLPNFLFQPICRLMYRAHLRLTYGV